jgi:hypothetical protein
MKPADITLHSQETLVLTDHLQPFSFVKLFCRIIFKNGKP